MTRQYGPVLSLGAGVQSTALLMLSAEGRLPKLVAAIFADTGWEPKAVYDHLNRLEREVADPAGIPIIRVQWGNIRTDATEGHRWLKMPVFVLSADGKRGQGSRQCTQDYKIEPIKRKLRELMGAKVSSSGAILRPPAGAVMEQWIGISRDEFHRAKSAGEPWLVNRFPLLDMDWTRQDCLTYLAERSWGNTPKSACIGCPFHGNRMWREMRDGAPDEFADAVEFDRQLRSGEVRGGDRYRGQLYLHTERVPLDQADLRSPAQKPRTPARADCGTRNPSRAAARRSRASATKAKVTLMQPDDPCATAAPLVQRAADPSTVVPATWCVVECCQGCRETWTVDVADFEPRLTASDVERMLTPLLLDHEQAHQGVWR